MDGGAESHLNFGMDGIGCNWLKGERTRLRVWIRAGARMGVAGLALVLPLAGPVPAAEAVEDIGDRLELFVDRELTDRMEGLSLRLHRPQRMPLPENPLPVPYTTVIWDGEIYRAWYRDIVPGYSGKRGDGHPGEITCYAESADGHEWQFPDLGIHAVRSSRGGNVVLAGAAPASHNFTPFLDSRPGVMPEARFKALGGTHPGGGLYAFHSPDGIHWKQIREEPVMTSEAFAFDSQNAVFWSEAEARYVCYFRTWETPHGRLRTISRTTSPDFLNWSEPVPMHPNAAGEHLYTNQTQPYFRAPHIYLAFPTRFFPDRGNSTDILFMASRAGSAIYTRLFREAYIRPGEDPERWGNRSNYLALNAVPTGPGEISLYHRSGHRYTLRTDGFISLHAGWEAGEWISKPFVFAGGELMVNLSTSAAGGLRTELLDASGRVIPGFSLADSEELVGDSIGMKVSWEGNPDLEALSGTPVRLRFVMRESDLYSFRFRED